MEKWVVAAKKADFNKMAAEYHIDPVIARLIRNRDIIKDDEIRQYLYGGLESLHSPWLLKDMKKAVEIVGEKIKEGKKIRIIGDYDIDGVTSTYILITGLKRAGADADTYIPDRVADGYGIHRHLVEKAVQDGIDTIITCDNGIAAGSEIMLAKELGLTVVVTDHHEIPYKETETGRVCILPPADAIINPKQEDCEYPFKGLCGAVVAFKFITALYQVCGIDAGELEDFLEIAAIATVGDVMDLQEENRILVKEGLKRLQNTKNPGLRELIRANQLEGRQISAYHIGFVLGPCLNASGRLDTAVRSLRLLQATDQENAAKLAGDLVAMNQSRKALTLQGAEDAFHQIETTEIGKDRVLVVFLPQCHESLAGIIAGRIREKYYKPAFVLTRGEQGVKGSGRSIETYHMYEALVSCSELLTKFGGHKMAAGLSLDEENVENFRKKINENCKLTQEDLMPKVMIDVPMPVSYISYPLIEQLELLEPFGKGNTKPVFAQRDLRLTGCRVFGQNKNVVKMKALDSQGYSIDAVYFGDSEALLERVKQEEPVSVIYYPTVNTYQGRQSLQIVIQNYR